MDFMFMSGAAFGGGGLFLAFIVLIWGSINIVLF